MSDIDRHDLHTRNATAYFETREAADAAVNDLVTAGIARDQISIGRALLAQIQRPATEAFGKN
jgi:hypothetical protein